MPQILVKLLKVLNQLKKITYAGELLNLHSWSSVKQSV